MEKIIVAFDTETNGFKPHNSVLSISAKKIKINLKEKTMESIGDFNRFYYRGEDPHNQKAIDINGLTSEKIKELRGDATYPEFYNEDRKSFEEFCKDIDLLVAHNYDFDSQFIDFTPLNSYCTMKEGSYIYKSTTGITAWPKLKDLAKFFNVKFEDENLHGSEYDVLILSRILFRMLKREDRNFMKKL